LVVSFTGSLSFQSATAPYQRKAAVLVSLQKAAQQIASILELDELLDTIVEGGEFHLAAVHGCTQSEKGERWPITEGLAGHVVSTGRPYYAPDVSQELLYRPCEPHVRSELLIP
jgi:hypothetical protein